MASPFAEVGVLRGTAPSGGCLRTVGPAIPASVEPVPDAEIVAVVGKPELSSRTLRAPTLVRVAGS